MINCHRCGKENQDMYKFCLGCGAELKAAGSGGDGNVAMMKTMMADTSQAGGMSASPAGNAPPMGAPPAMAPPPAAPQAVGGPRVCGSCGTDVPPNFKFCGVCGTPFAGPPSSQTTPNPQYTPQAAPQAQVTKATLTLIRPDGSEGGTHELRQGENKLGRTSGGLFEQDGYLSPVHADVHVNGQTATIRDLDSLNGVFVRMTDEEELQPGQIVRLGQELLRFDFIEPPAATQDGTEIMGSPNPGFWGKITVIIGRDVDGSAFPLLGESVTIGRERGDINFPDDGYVSGLHSRLSIRDGRVFLGDLGSSNGTFIKIQGERTVGHDSFILLGQQLFRVDLG